jgi:hypothetical protein
MSQLIVNTEQISYELLKVKHLKSLSTRRLLRYAARFHKKFQKKIRKKCEFFFLIKRMFHQNFFPDTILGICYVFPVIHIIPLLYSQLNSLCP